MPIARLTSKGQVTIPKPVREALGIDTGDEIDFVRAAVALLRSGPGDFSDHLLGLRNRNAGCADTATFDRKLRAAEGFQLL